MNESLRMIESLRLTQSLRISESESEWDEEEWDDGWDDHEWRRRVDPLVNLINRNGQGDFCVDFNFGEEVDNNNCLSALYILYCNQKKIEAKNENFQSLGYHCELLFNIAFTFYDSNRLE